MIREQEAFMHKLGWFGVQQFLVVAVLVLFTNTSWATYPGQNGRIAFVADFGGTWQIYSINADGSDLVQVTNLPQTELFPGNWLPSFSPDGGRIAFSHDMTGALEIYVINADGTGLKQVTHDGAENQVPRWSPDGSRILFASQYILTPRHDDHQLASIRDDGTDRQTITRTLFDDFGAVYTMDGKQIVLSSTRENLISAMWLLKADGSRAKRITEAAEEAGAADISPDGEHIVFVNQNNTELPDNVIVSRVNGTHQSKITERGFFLDPVYSPDGTELVFGLAASESDPFEIYTMSANGADRTRVISCPDSCWTPTWGAKGAE
jgi:Tol biopolymer transport system component